MLQDALVDVLSLDDHSKDRSFCIALSGGADSIALLRSMSELQKRFAFSLRALHLNFGLRGKESNGDQKFVEKTCKALKIEIICKKVKVKKTTNIQDQCRKFRMAAYAELGRSEEILEAHHSNDQVETFFLKLFRGAGLDGLSGMPSLRQVEDRKVWRPFLKISKDQILQTCKAKRWTFRTDSSNLKTDYDRNYIRRILMPKIRKRFPHAQDAILRTMTILRKSNEVLDDKFATNAGASMEWESLKNFSESELAEFWKRSFKKSYELTLSFRQVEELVALTKGSRPFSFNAPKGFIVRGRAPNRVDKAKIDIILR